MYPVKLDYVDNTVVWTREGVVWLGLGLCGLLVTGLSYGQVSDETAQITAQRELLLQAAGRERREQDLVAGELKTFRAEIKESQTVLAQLARPWDSLFVGLERAALRHREGIALLAIRPDAEAGRVMIDGAAADLDAVWDFVGALADIDIIRHADLSHHHLDETNGTKPVRFSILAEWKVQR